MLKFIPNSVKLFKLYFLISILFVTSLNLYADQDVTTTNIDGIKIVGEKSVTLTIKPKSVLRSSTSAQTITKKIKVLDIEISNSLKQELVAKANDIQTNNDAMGVLSSIEVAGTLSVDLGMNSVPVLDQGVFGTCVTFANTALLNALMNSGDYISQQCLLELGTYQQNKFNLKSGWNGLNSSVVILERIKNYGVIEKNTCPHSYANPNYEMDYQSYLSYSNKLWADSFAWKKLGKGNLEQVKEALNKGHRIATAAILHSNYILGDGINGNWSGLWQLPKDVNQFIKEINSGSISGHAVIIIGYDDAKGLLKLRNSWGSYIGDEGNYYMTYEYYKLLNIESIEVY
jgi:hypothetical protein